MRIVVTGSGGLIGWHSAAHLHAANCAARFKGEMAPFDIVRLDHDGFANDVTLFEAVSGADAILHFAGVNRANDGDIEKQNPEIARRLVDACVAAGVRPHIVYANSTHSTSDSPYGRSKRVAGEILGLQGGLYTDIILPHIFGEFARPRYNNVTATFIEAVIAGKSPEINSEGRVSLLHAGAAAKIAIDAVVSKTTGTIRPKSRDILVPQIFAAIQKFHADYKLNIFPDLRDPFMLALFNSYRSAVYPDCLTQPLKIFSDARGTLFEAVKGGGGGQTFLSSTKSGMIRGDHFHLNKVERFLVVQGEAIIRIRKVFDDQVWEYSVSGDRPMPIDMPTLHTHSIENIGSEPLITLFWTHEIFDPAASDTYFDPVLKAKP